MKTQIFKISLMLFIVIHALQLRAQDVSDYKLTVDAKVSNQGIGQKPGFSEWKTYPTRSVKTIGGFVPKKVKLDRYGGRADMKATATGFYHVQKINGRWWAVDPLGNLFIKKGLNEVQPGASERNKTAFQDKFTDNHDWAIKTTSELSKLGFNGAGAWSNYQQLKNVKPETPLACMVMLDFMGSYGRKKGAYQSAGHLGYPDNTIFVFDPEFEKFAGEYAKQIAVNIDDKNIFGYFSDNELPFYKKTLDSYLSKRDTTDVGYQAAASWLKRKNVVRTEITDQLRKEFLGVVADKYFSIVSAAIKKNDPNHMYIGCRFHSYEKGVPEVFQAAGKYVDVVSVNYYDVWTPQQQQMENWATWSGKPFLISEWYVKGEDSGMGNISGAGWVVKTQEDRGLFYQNYTLSLLESGNCVGWQWFKYQDNDPTNKNVDPSNSDSNKGILNNEYQFYNAITSKMKELNDAAYSLIDFFDSKKK
ncbi:hypothetical protein ACFQ3S_03985 [Mucilaginibacter terrae]|uniref:hypothetical protein n=1 Tax=Mucilaginibacter terrae TaxID=1955052 RepID=UPI003628106D